MIRTSLASAIKLNPWRFIRSRWPYRALLFVGGCIVLAPLGAVAASTILLVPAWGAALAYIDRRTVTFLGAERIPDERACAPREGLRDRLWTRHGEPLTWRESAYAILHLVVAIAAFLLLSVAWTFFATGALVPLILIINAFSSTHTPLGEASTDSLIWAIPLALFGLLLLLYAASCIALGLSFMAVQLLSPSPEALRRQVAQLARSKALIQDEFDSRLRELERQIHDGAQIRLSSAALHLGLLEHRLRNTRGAQEDFAECLAILETVRSEHVKSMDALRDSIRTLRPRALQEGGLVPAIREVSCALPLNINVKGPACSTLPAGVEYALLQIAKEALTNIAKHAAASEVDIALALTEAQCELTITDDGVGGADPLVGTGIIGMQERAHLLGGTFSLSSPKGGPTRLTIQVPGVSRAVQEGDRR